MLGLDGSRCRVRRGYVRRLGPDRPASWMRRGAPLPLGNRAPFTRLQSRARRLYRARSSIPFPTPTSRGSNSCHLLVSPTLDETFQSRARNNKPGHRAGHVFRYIPFSGRKIRHARRVRGHPSRRNAASAYSSTITACLLLSKSMSISKKAP